MTMPIITHAQPRSCLVPDAKLDNEALIERYARRHNHNTAVVKAVVECESRMYENATGTQAVVGKDIGLMQINTYYHEDRAERMEIDIHTRSGNLEYGMRLMKEKGLQPWSASRHCWGPKI